MTSHPNLITPLFFSFLISISHAVTINVINQCSYTVWGAASPGGGQQLDSGASWSFQVDPGTVQARVWARTGCSFDSNGNGNCETGDCGGILVCTGYGKSPNTLAEYALNQAYGLDYFDISLVEGFNVPLSFLPTSNGCSSGPTCAADITSQCPSQLQVPGGCNNPCPIFNTNEYCCTDGPGTCGPTSYSEFFKNLCPTSFSYPQDYVNDQSTCPGNSNYQVVFCP